MFNLTENMLTCMTHHLQVVSMQWIFVDLNNGLSAYSACSI